VAIAATVLFIARLILRDTFLFGENTFGALLEFITTLLAIITVVYYGFKVFRYLKLRLLWRVRRRLAITYLFVGLTPIVLLALLGISAMLGAGQAMSRIVAVGMIASERQTWRARTLFTMVPAACRRTQAIASFKHGSMSARGNCKQFCRERASLCGVKQTTAAAINR
jgi:hypothetical protein